jgi:hypothetical protein
MGARRKPEGAKVIDDDDLLKLLRVSGDAILIGGQALAFWIAYFSIEIPPGPQTFVSHDADFLGFAEDVGRFAKAVGGRAVYPRKRDITALEGVVVVPSASGDTIGVDVLWSVVGLDAGAVRKRAVEISDPSDRSLTFKVMHPVDCMTSRFENLRQLADKRNAVGAWQARLGILICRAYIGRLLAGGDEAEAIRAATKIMEVAGTAPGLQAYHRFGLELLDAIPVDQFTSGAFKTQQYARTTNRIRTLRDAFRPPPTKR